MNPEEASAIFTELKNFNGITNPKTQLTKVHWDNFKNNYQKETGLDPNRYGFIDNVVDLDKALKWGTVSSLGLAPIVFNYDK